MSAEIIPFPAQRAIRKPKSARRKPAMPPEVEQGNFADRLAPFLLMLNEAEVARVAAILDDARNARKDWS